MKNLPVGMRLALAFTLVLTGLLVTAGAAWWAIGTLSDTVSSMYQDNTVAGTELAKTSTALLNYRNLVIQIIGTQSKEDFDEMAAELPTHRANVEQYLQSYQVRKKRAVAKRDESKDFAALQQGIEEYFALDQRTIDRIKAAMAAADPKEKERLRQAAIQNSFYAAGPSMNAAGESMNHLLDTVVELARDSKEAGEQAGATARTVLEAALLLCLLFAGVITWAITRSITIPLKQVNEVLGLMEHGDLTHRLTYTSKDELGVVCTNVNHFVDRLHELLAQVVTSARTLNLSASRLSFVVEKVTTASDTQAKEATGAAATVSELASNSTRVSSGANEVAAKALEASAAANEGGSAIGATIDSMQSVFQTIQHAGDMIKGLGTTSHEIGNIAKVIYEIADQTNLLALNAAIEAARAGEQGRGFAVVADEVRKLAERTSRATKEIGNMIAAIQKDATTAVTSMAGSSTQVAEGKERVDQTGGHLAAIVTAVAIVTKMVQDIAGQADAQSSTSNLVAETINHVASMSQDNKETAGQMLAEAVTLTNTASALKRSVEVFKLREQESPETEAVSAVH
ncbi:MAG: methyl-accepting chemotaxis protein [Nitrospiraceae bacterium]